MSTAPLRRLAWRPSAEVIDVAVVVAVAFPTLMDAWWNEEGTPQADWLTYCFGVVSVAALLVRRRWPYAVTLVCAAALTGWNLRDQYGELLNLPTMVGLYTIAARGPRRNSVVVGLVAAVWSGVLATTDPAPAGAVDGPAVLETVWPIIPLMLGEVVRSRRVLQDEYAARAELAERERDREARERVAAERLRIAREFHDVVAHTMAAVNVQMGVAEAAFDRQPDTAREAIVQARSSSRDALHELRAAIALLRESPSSERTAPAPRLADVDDLAAAVRAAGVAVVVDDDSGGRHVPAAVEQAAFRIVQEALTNVVRHSGAAHASVSLRHADGALTVDVVDDGSSSPSASSLDNLDGNGGYGLIGMSERAVALGGRLTYGRRAGGGFAVHAVLPTGADAA